MNNWMIHFELSVCRVIGVVYTVKPYHGRAGRQPKNLMSKRRRSRLLKPFKVRKPFRLHLIENCFLMRRQRILPCLIIFGGDTKQRLVRVQMLLNSGNVRRPKIL